MQPAPALQPFVSSLHYHQSETPFSKERILPGGNIHLMFNLCEDEFRTYSSAGAVDRTSAAIVQGPHTRPVVIDTRLQRRLVTVNFTSGGAAALLLAPLMETGNRLVDLDLLWGRQAGVLRERLLEAASPAAALAALEGVLAARLARAAPPDRAMVYAEELLARQGYSVRSVTARLGLLPKTFVRRFLRHTGLRPKQFARLHRFKRVVAGLRDPRQTDWAAVAAEHGFSDQSHLIHDFRVFADMTPRDYRPRSADEPNHVPVVE